jgi:predicted dehydrogenase
VAVCDPVVERVQRQAQVYGIEHALQGIDQMLTELDFELLVNLAPMPLHAPINRKLLLSAVKAATRHIEDVYRDRQKGSEP